MENNLTIFQTSSLIWFQACWQQRLGKPSGSGALSGLILKMVSLISSLVGMRHIKVLISSSITEKNIPSGKLRTRGRFIWFRIGPQNGHPQKPFFLPAKHIKYIKESKVKPIILNHRFKPNIPVNIATPFKECIIYSSHIAQSHLYESIIFQSHLEVGVVIGRDCECEEEHVVRNLVDEHH